MQAIDDGIHIVYSLDRVPTLKAFTLSDARWNAVIGPVGSGKSACLTQNIYHKSLKQNPNPRDGIIRTRWAIVRNTFSQLNDTTIRTIMDWWPPAHFGQYKVADHRYVITAFPGMEIELLFRPLDTVEDIQKLLSLELTGAWVNEAREVPWATIIALDSRLGRFPAPKDGGCTQPSMLLDSNPPEEETAFAEFLENPPSNAAVFKQPSGLSPQAENVMTWDEYNQFQADLLKFGKSDIVPGLKPDYYKELVIGKPKDWIDVYVNAQYGFVKEGRAVYENCFNDSLHVSKDRIRPIEGRELVIAFDYGLTPACAIMQISPRGYLNVLREFVSDGMGIEQFLRSILNPALKMEYGDFDVVFTGDPSGANRSQTDEKTCYDIMRETYKDQIIIGKYRIAPLISNNPASRIGAVEHYLNRLTDGKATFRLDPSCKMIRKGFNKAYYYRQVNSRDERYSDKPEKNIYSHIMEAVEYGCMFIKEGVAKDERRKKIIPHRAVACGRAGY